MFAANSISVRYDRTEVVRNFSFMLERGEILSIIGPNGSGKSTILRAISGWIPYHTGKVYLQDEDLAMLSSRQIARKLCMLSQKNQAPHDMTVRDLVSYGRYPHKRWFERLDAEDMEIVDWALRKTHMNDYRDRTVSSLSGGESQRVWIAMALTQRPHILLLDEPTTYLDISHQHEVLELVRELNREMGLTVIMVLHDLNQAARYSDRIIVVQSGEKVFDGTPAQVMTREMIREVYRMDAEIQYTPQERTPRIHLLSSIRSSV